MKKIILFLIILLFVPFCGCKNNSVNQSENYGEKEKYCIIEENGNIYIKINDYDILHSTSQFGDLVFESVDDFLYSLNNGFDDMELKVINSFEKDASGLIKTFDYNNILYPNCYDGYKVKQFFWSGENYGYYLESSDKSFCYLHCCNTRSFINHFTKEYDAFFDNDNVNLLTCEQDEKNRNIYYFTTLSGNFKSIRYELNNDFVTMKIEELYVLSSNSKELVCSMDIPHRIRIYVGDGLNYFFEFYNLSERYNDVIENANVVTLKNQKK